MMGATAAVWKTLGEMRKAREDDWQQARRDYPDLALGGWACFVGVVCLVAVCLVNLALGSDTSGDLKQVGIVIGKIIAVVTSLSFVILVSIWVRRNLTRAGKHTKVEIQADAEDRSLETMAAHRTYDIAAVEQHLQSEFRRLVGLGAIVSAPLGYGAQKVITFISGHGDKILNKLGTSLGWSLVFDFLAAMVFFAIYFFFLTRGSLERDIAFCRRAMKRSEVNGGTAEAIFLRDEQFKERFAKGQPLISPSEIAPTPFRPSKPDIVSRWIVNLLHRLNFQRNEKSLK